MLYAPHRPARPSRPPLWANRRNHRFHLSADRQSGDHLVVAGRSLSGRVHRPAAEPRCAHHLPGDGGRRGIQNRTRRRSRPRSDARRIASRRAGWMRVGGAAPIRPRRRAPLPGSRRCLCGPGGFRRRGVLLQLWTNAASGRLHPDPPPEFFATPPPGAFATPPPGAFVFPPSAGGIVGELVGMVFTILIGTAAATAAATIAGQAGTAARSRALEKGAN